MKGMKGTIGTVIAVFVISLGIWTAYSFTTYPLDPGSTAVVVGVVALLVWGVQWFATRMKAQDTGSPKHEIPEPPQVPPDAEAATPDASVPKA